MLKNELIDLSITKKICLSGIFIALVVIFNKVIALNYIPIIPFVRISFGSIALLIFASIVLGPFYGLVIGAAADVLGYFVFEDKRGKYSRKKRCKRNYYARIGCISIRKRHIFKKLIKRRPQKTRRGICKLFFKALRLKGMRI